MTKRPETWMSTVSTINGRPQAQSALHANGVSLTTVKADTAIFIETPSVWVQITIVTNVVAHPPRAMATPTSAKPNSIVQLPATYGFESVNFPHINPTTNSDAISRAFETRRAKRGSEEKIRNGITAGITDAKSIQNMAPIP